jgi:hypothetical protein
MIGFVESVYYQRVDMFRMRPCNPGRRRRGRERPALRTVTAALHVGYYNPNTNSMVALAWDLSSGERAIFALPTGPMPEAMAMYCLPFTA